MVVRGIRCENCPNETFHYYCLTDPNGNGQETHAKCPICKADIELSLRVRRNNTNKTEPLKNLSIITLAQLGGL